MVSISSGQICTIVIYSPAHLIGAPCVLHFLHYAWLSTQAPADGSCPDPAVISPGRTGAVCRSPLPRRPAYFDRHLIRQGIYKIIVPQYPAVSQALPFLPGLYGEAGHIQKNCVSVPCWSQKSGYKATIFLYIPWYAGKKLFFCSQGLRAGYREVIFLYIPRPLSGTENSVYVHGKTDIFYNVPEIRIHPDFRLWAMTSPDLFGAGYKTKGISVVKVVNHSLSLPFDMCVIKRIFII